MPGNPSFQRATPRALLIALAIGGCAKKPDTRPALDPDRASGPDGKRPGAVAIAPTGVTRPDEVSFDKGDATDWKSIDLAGAPATLALELRWDDDKSDLGLDLFDAAGNTVATGPGPRPGAVSKKITAAVDRDGTYYLRVLASEKSGSVYTIESAWSGQRAAPPPPASAPAPAPATPETPPAPAPAEPAATGPTEEEIENGVQGRIVSSHAEGGELVLFLDKGSSAGVKVGQMGAVLDGPTGASALAGGTFTITKVVDATKCIAKTALKSLGKNRRVSIVTSR